MLDAAALRAQDVDLDAGTVTVTDTGHHKPKTRNSCRTIPVCTEDLDALKVARRTDEVLNRRAVNSSPIKRTISGPKMPWRSDGVAS